MKSFVILISLLIFTSSTQKTEVLSRSAKKVDKYLSSLWPEMEIEKELILEDFLSEREELYRLSVEGYILGFMILDQEMSKYDHFDYMVVFDMEGAIVKSHILVYREDYGGEIASQRWLKQFIGKTSDDPIELRNDISGISGATISCRSACSGIKDLSVKMERILSMYSNE